MLGCVILNFNDAPTTIKLVRSIKNYRVINYLVIVDNHSTDNSFVELKKLEALDCKHIKVIRTVKNGGYGYGNNVGIRYCKQLGCNYVLIANPDVSFLESTIQESLAFLVQHQECAAVAPKMVGGGAIKFANPLKDMTFSIMLLNRIFKPRYYSPHFYKNKTWAYVDALPGSLVLFDLNKFYLVGLYDESVFLYHEEVIIGKRLAAFKFKSALLLKTTYYHYHSISVKKTYKKSIKPKEIAMNSHKYYLKKYCHANKLVLSVFSLVSFIAQIEMFIWLHLKK